MRPLYRNLFLLFGIAAIVVMLCTFDVDYAQLRTHLRRAGLYLPGVIGVWVIVYALNARAFQNIVNSGNKVQGSFGGVEDETNGYPLWMGGETASAAKFKVKYDGTLEATGANISGTVNATDGVFAGDIKLNGLTYGDYIYGGQNVVLGELEAGVIKEIAYFCPTITRSSEPAYLTVASSKVVILPATATSSSKTVSSLSVWGIGKLVGINIAGVTVWMQCPYSVSWTS